MQHTRLLFSTLRTDIRAYVPVQQQPEFLRQVARAQVLYPHDSVHPNASFQILSRLRQANHALVGRHNYSVAHATIITADLDALLARHQDLVRTQRRTRAIARVPGTRGRPLSVPT